MSYATMYVVEKSGEVVPLAEFRNSWGAGAMVWSSLCNKYGIKDQYGYTSSSAWEKLWKDVREEKIKIEPFEYNVLYSTYDNAMVKYEDLGKFISSLQAFEEAHKVNEQVCHMKSFARELEKVEKCIGVCFQQTSVAEDQWTEYDEENDENVPYNTKKGTKHWFVEMK